MKLSQREKLALTVGGIVILAFILLQFMVLPLLDKRDRLQQRIVLNGKQFDRMMSLQKRYQELHSQSISISKHLQNRSPDFSLFSFLEQMASRADVKKQIIYMKPSKTLTEGNYSEIMVEMKLQTITLQQLIDFLEYIESPDNVVAIKRISVQVNTKDEAALDVILQIVTINLVENTKHQVALTDVK